MNVFETISSNTVSIKHDTLIAVRKLDVFNHIYPRPYFDLMMAVAPTFKDIGKRMRNIPMLIDLDERFRVMDRFGGLSAGAVDRDAADRGVLERAATASTWRGRPTTAWRRWSRSIPDRFPGFVASLPLGDADAAMRETERAVGELGARGIQVFSNINGKPLDRPEYLALFDRMAAFDLPVWLHPFRGADVTDYATESKSLLRDLVDVRMALRDQRGDGAPGVLRHLRSASRTENHHASPWRDGAVLRGTGRTRLGSVGQPNVGRGLRRGAEAAEEAADRLLPDVLRRHGGVRRLRCHGVRPEFLRRRTTCCSRRMRRSIPERGPMYIRETIAILDRLPMPEADRQKIYWRNAVDLLKLGAT